MMSHEDIETLVEATRIVYEIGGEVTLAPYDKLSDAGSVTEFCIGGPESNKRTKVHLDNFLKGVQMAPYSNTPDSLMIMTKSENFRYEKHEEEYAILARFWSTPNTLPVFLICGQTGRANRGAVHYLAQNYDSSLRRKFDTDSFCLIVKIKSPLTYGYKVVSLVKDITESAFTEMSKEIIS
ncbi:MAG: hypothetical protein GY797_36780 [Deltaproteobacteria bacterium]|nr:hypothetical protein [Deltaproteobacteria bacterium]